MFNNLIESSSHKREFKRRGSFFLYTVVGYAVLFAAGGVASIYAYDVHLDEQNAEITMLTFVPPEPINPASPTPVRNAGTKTNDNPHNTPPSAPVLFDNPNRPHLTPDFVGTTPAPFPPAGRDGKVGPYHNPLGGGSPGTGDVGNSTGDPGGTVDAGTPPPPPPPVVTPPKPPQIIRKNVINGEALDLPKPLYPQLARINRIQGSVSVQVLIDENGKVISAHAVSGNVFLTSDAVKAAYRARFSPTKLGDQPVKVSGVITYNFVLN